MATITLSNEQLNKLAMFDTIELDNGYFMRLLEMPDHHTEINDFDCYGKVSWCARNPYTGHYSPRPEGFDGMAEIVRTYNGEGAWWQPPADLRDTWNEDTPLRNKLRTTVREILDYGFRALVLELLKGRDAYGNHIVVAYSNTNGIEPLMDRADVASVVSDMVYDLTPVDYPQDSSSTDVLF